MKKNIFGIVSIIAIVFSSCNSINKSNIERDDMIQVASQFLDVLKSNDTLKAKSMLLYGLLNSNDETFAHNVNLASHAINKYGLPKNEKISLDSSVHNVPTTIAIEFPIYTAVNPDDDFQKAVIKVCVQKISGKYKVVLFVNEFENKMTPLTQ